MDSRLVLSVSAVPYEWVTGAFAAGFEAAVRANWLVWIVVDHPSEGDALLESLRSRDRTRRSIELEVPPLDSSLFWSRLTGIDDETGVLRTLLTADLCFVFGGARLHHETLTNWLPSIRAIATGSKCGFVIPVHRRTVQEAPGLVDVGTATLDVPAFAGVSRRDKLELTELLVQFRFTQCGKTPSPTLASELLDAQPLNRAELESWVRAHADSESGALSVARMPRLHGHPELPLSRADLSASFEVTRRILRDTDRAYTNWTGSKLFSPVREAYTPFESVDPFAWFVASVSYAACQYFDASEATFARLAQIRVQADGHLAFERSPAFLVDLRALRTRFQHALDWGRPEDRDTHDRAAAWFAHRCGASRPGREHWRCVTAAFLAEWQDFAEAMLANVRTAVGAPNRDMIEEDLSRVAGRLPLHRWQDVVARSASALGVPIEIGRFLKRFQSDLVDALRRSPVSPDALESVAESLVEERLLTLDVRPRMNGGHLVAAGVPQGPLVRQGLEIATRLQNSEPRLTVEEMVVRVLRELGIAAPE